MHAETFAIAVYNSDREVLNFMGIDGKDQQLVYGTDSLKHGESLSVQCFLNLEEITIENFSVSHKDIAEARKVIGSVLMESLIYLPLVSIPRKIF